MSLPEEAAETGDLVRSRIILCQSRDWDAWVSDPGEVSSSRSQGASLNPSSAPSLKLDGERKFLRQLPCKSVEMEHSKGN
ncbi:hypothetical protein PAAG_11593 [Paracoccidioides lutzii Pb01]|uniref:Uncharacterized protein n=1 Tax=Paracoccidioides lutzii (strain ATCC MYA-826 / Pb01) TaxID=502779 RepID=A0A0A2V5K5_PARBA|nr:hypothetical protein PAAG_11593 [Paracoccidioides lutzii Pb01]KGQ01612.1 hypothetical protein PAAG_11593 [Paracoccidioides lutzii Pb01]